MIVATEVRNIPQAVKETLILLTPAGALAFPFMLTLLFRNRGQHEPEAAFAGTAIGQHAQPDRGVLHVGL